RLHSRIGIDEERFCKSLRFGCGFYTVGCVIEITGSRNRDFLASSKCPTTRSDHRNRNNRRTSNPRHRLVAWPSSPSKTRTRSHSKNEFATSHQITVQQERLVVRLAIQGRGLNINIALRNSYATNHKRFAILQIEAHFRKQRRTDHINRRSRSHRIKPRGTQHVPRRHLPAVLIANQSIRIWLVKLVHDLTNARLRFPRLAHVVIKIGHVMTRFVPMSVLTNQSRDVDLLATGGATVSRKQLIQFLSKLPASTHQCNETADILRCEERVLPRICFRKCKRNLTRIERLEPIPVAARAHKS